MSEGSGRMRRRWFWLAGALGVGLLGSGLACGDDLAEGPSAEEREARARVLHDLLASSERLPDPEELQAQRHQLEGQGEDGQRAQGGSGRELPAAYTSGTVEWVGDDELLFREPGGAEQEVHVDERTRFVENGQAVNRSSVREGTKIRVYYDVEPVGWVARAVELLPSLPDLPER